MAMKGVVIHWTNGSPCFELDRSVDVQVSEIFSKDDTGNLIFKHSEDGVLGLACLEPLKKAKERFLPEKIFIRSSLQTALKYRIANDETRTVVFGSPGVGKSVFCFLAAIAVAAIGMHDAVLYVRRQLTKQKMAILCFG